MYRGQYRTLFNLTISSQPRCDLYYCLWVEATGQPGRGPRNRQVLYIGNICYAPTTLSSLSPVPCRSHAAVQFQNILSKLLLFAGIFMQCVGIAPTIRRKAKFYILFIPKRRSANGRHTNRSKTKRRNARSRSSPVTTVYSRRTARRKVENKEKKKNSLFPHLHRLHAILSSKKPKLDLKLEASVSCMLTYRPRLIPANRSNAVSYVLQSLDLRCSQ